jgi:LytS/YehU family sensor histidine kinase
MIELGYLIRHYTLPVFSSTLLFLFTKFFIDYKRERERSLLLKNEKSELELKTLKAQLNPHFLFNTLNNIYSLSVTESEKVPEAIGKLAEILDTVLYKCDTDFVSVTSEIELLKNYVELEKLRYDDRLEVHFNKYIESNNLVPPLVLLSLVENAFKHGAGEDSGSPKIWIDIEANKNETRFRIRNTVFKLQNSEERMNIGFPNIRKQLELLYGNDYTIETTVSDNLFEVNLMLKNQPEDEN